MSRNQEDTRHGSDLNASGHKAQTDDTERNEDSGHQKVRDQEVQHVQSSNEDQQ